MMTKHCAKCDSIKPREDFGSNVGRNDGLSVYCKPCTREYMASKDYDKQRWLLHRDREIERNKQYRAANAAREIERCRAKAKRLRSERPDVVNAANKARKAAQRRAIPKWADMDHIRLIYAKARELSQAFGIDMQVDHIVPLRGKTVCGLHTPANLQLLAAGLNHKKRHWAWPDMP